MNDFKIEVRGAKPPRKPDGVLKRIARKVGCLVRALLMRPRLMAFAGAVVFAAVVGTPHVGWDYACRYSPGPGQPCRSVSYCAYYGIQGRRVVFPERGDACKLITFLPPDWAKLQSP